MPLSNMTVYAVWTKRPTVTCIDGTRRVQYTLDPEGRIAPLDPDPKAGKKFSGWLLNGQKIDLTTHVFTENAELHASWETLPVIRFKVDSNTVYQYSTDSRYRISPPILADRAGFRYEWTIGGQGVDVEALIFREDTEITARFIALPKVLVQTAEGSSEEPIDMALALEEAKMAFIGKDASGQDREITVSHERYQKGKDLAAKYDKKKDAQAIDLEDRT